MCSPPHVGLAVGRLCITTLVLRSPLTQFGVWCIVHKSPDIICSVSKENDSAEITLVNRALVFTISGVVSSSRAYHKVMQQVHLHITVVHAHSSLASYQVWFNQGHFLHCRNRLQDLTVVQPNKEIAKIEVAITVAITGVKSPKS